MPRRLPDQNLTDQHDKAVQLETTVRGLLDVSRVRDAHRVFDEEWQRTILPHLPLRVPFVLDRVDRHGIAVMIDRDVMPALELRSGVDRRQPQAVAVMISDADEAIGFLPDDALTVLERAGDDADLYGVKLLSGRVDESGTMIFDMELWRADLRQCEACEELHAGDKPKCENCLKGKKRKKRGAEAHNELPAVPLQRTFREIVEHPLHKAKD